MTAKDSEVMEFVATIRQTLSLDEVHRQVDKWIGHHPHTIQLSHRAQGEHKTLTSATKYVKEEGTRGDEPVGQLPSVTAESFSYRRNGIFEFLFTSKMQEQ